MSDKTMNLTKYLLIVFISVINGSNCMVPMKDFFPYGTNVNDTDIRNDNDGGLDDGSSHPIQLRQSFRFFNTDYTRLWVNINGGVSFNGPISDYTPNCTALNRGMSMITPFWADIDLESPGRGSLTYGQTNDEYVLNQALDDIKKAKHEISSLEWAFIATWVDVPYYKDSDCRTSLKNTFQMALVTDGPHSFAIFKYNRMEWTTGSYSGAPDCSGLGGKPARAGFDNGRGQMSIIEGSCKNNILNVVDFGLTPGKFVFRVDEDEITSIGSSTLAVITNTNTATHPSATQQPTTPLTEFRRRFITLENNLNDIKTKLLSDCRKMDSRPVLARECYEEVVAIMDLELELNTTRTLDELILVERSYEQIVIKVDRIEKDLNE